MKYLDLQFNARYDKYMHVEVLNIILRFESCGYSEVLYLHLHSIGLDGSGTDDVRQLVLAAY